jgi:hypothetical protein
VQVPGAASASAPSDPEPVPGGLYWRVLAAAAKAYRLRGATVRLCLLAHTLDAWRQGVRSSASFHLLEVGCWSKAFLPTCAGVHQNRNKEAV